ncbi:glutathione S-transferase [Tistlia consotensis]|uniref:Glutathione S-transferase n=1 Tax=Tistlia consotensis USBA 355 TaxID=560819 RepID=A0A1Y6BFW6_9PROT|nr:glutathione S-transferase family protein [Tistlia consotensis]SMF07228.1 glutathione S-transferase [Tistlia consotensis USBA 355]SNR36005.1 glutathione S-transferase [Tistlia consotensis]
MSGAEFTLVVANKNYSSWSLRGWLALKLALAESGAGFEEIVIPLDQPETRAAILVHSPSGKVPLLRHGALSVWDSLAIGEYLAERFPSAGLWPEDPTARAVARSVVAEMHSGFASLRAELPMDMRNRAPASPSSKTLAEIARVQEIWNDCRAGFGAGGDFLFGRPGLPDCFYAPVVSRFVTYGIPLDGAAAAYAEAVQAWSPYREWLAAGEIEPWVLERP